ncbi:hypothetical protein MNBD_ACTINO01-1598 [hydrothermal vent metagenome]|uniref:DUF58 domain-containing protein n=1 Tax=hydrothermal vent metagenome TaxID=652676 RepID=A0A3B0SLL7_9ZZZZ
MPTTRGWAAIGAAVALGVLWAGFGEDLLLALAVFLLAAVAGGSLYVRLAVPRLVLKRRISPMQLHDGDRALVDLSLESRRKIFRVSIEDRVHGLGSATFVADRIADGDSTAGRYEVLCRPRGVYTVGPARVTIGDPLGFTESVSTFGVADRLVVYPRVEDLTGVPTGRGQDQTMNTSRASFWHSSGEDFFTLREYQHGDDIRKVHWPSSARRDTLMVKQLEMPWQSRAFIALDPRAEPHASGDSFEQAVRGAASVLHHLFRSGYTPTMWAGFGNGTLVGSPDAYTIAMEELATVRPVRSMDLRQVVAGLRRSGMAGGVFVMVTGTPDEADIATFQLLSQDFYRTVVLSVAEDDDDAVVRFAHAGALMVRTSATGKWDEPWRHAMEHGWSTATAG